MNRWEVAAKNASPLVRDGLDCQRAMFSHVRALQDRERWENQMRTDLINVLAGEMVPLGPSAAVAKHRLRHIIAADREAVPACRWVKKMDQCVTLVSGVRAIWPPRKLCRWERCR